MLRTSNELIRYDVEASDGKIGATKDLLFDDEKWRVRSIVVDTGGLLSRNEVLVHPEHVRGLKFPEETLILGLSKAQVQDSQGIDMAPPVSRQHEGHEHPPGQILDRHLRSSNEVSTYRMSAKDTELGLVHGLIIETSTWTIRYLIVDTGEWLTGKHVLLVPQAIQAIEWLNHSMKANVTADAIRNCPAYDETAELTRDYEAFLHDYYGWPAYWL